MYFGLNKKYFKNIFSICLTYIAININYRNPINPKILAGRKYAYLKFNIYLTNIIIHLNFIFVLVARGMLVF